MQSALTLVVAVAVWWVTRQLISADSSGSSTPANSAALHFILPIAMMALVIAAVVLQELRWYRPRRKLLRLMSEISESRMPIDAVKEVGGGIGPIASAVAASFHHARSLQRKLAQQELEMTQKVANRTDAMERVIGGLRQQAIRDGLTGLLNRRALDELLPRLIDHCRDKNEDLSLLMIDIDFFKQLNDQLGHAAGDEMLKTVGQIIRSSQHRAADVAFRCGGDEFVIVLPGCPLAPAQQLAAGITSLVEQMAKTIKSNPRPGLSVGVCSMSELPNPSAGELLREADKRLYDAKQSHHAKRRQVA